MADDDNDAYVLPDLEPAIPDEWQAGAVYTIEEPVRCPHCRKPMRTLRVLRLARTSVSFTSTLPRGGRVFACPHCERMLSAELSVM
jgi:hypothetical protein